MPATLEALQALHSELSAVRQHRLENLASLGSLLDEHAVAFKKLFDKKPRDSNSRAAVHSGKITIDEGEWALSQVFIDSILRLADELDLDEVETAKLLLEVDRGDDQDVRGRSLLECGVIRFHQQRRYLLECMLLCIEIADDDELDENLQESFGQIVSEKVFWAPAPGVPAPISERMVPKCIMAMQTIRAWLQQIAEKTASALFGGAPQEFQEIGELSRRCLVEQHEYLALLLCAAIEKRQAKTLDFRDFINMMKKIDKYDQLLVHLFPVLGAYITVFGSTEGLGDVQQSRELNTMICKQPDDDSESWTLILLRAAVQVWWIAEYSGWYLDDDNHGLQIDLDREEEDRAKQFMAALKDGAFDFILAVAADCKCSEWQDPARSNARQWLQRKSPPLPSDSSSFTDAFQRALMAQLEALIDGAITNIPDVLRRLRTEEDEQRQLNQAHEPDLDLERFLIIIAYTYEGRPETAISFWEDPDSNLAGFIQWTSRRASAPLVVAFCTMLQSLADSEECAAAAHSFLLEDGYHASGKMKRAHSLTWGQMFKEITLITEKARERPSTSQTTMYPRTAKPSAEPVEAEAESAMMLESYLRLAAKLTGESELARTKLWDKNAEMVVVLFRLASLQSIHRRVRACVFHLLRALLSRKTPDEGDFMWRCLDAWAIGQFAVNAATPSARTPGPNQSPLPLATMKGTLASVADGFDEPLALTKFLAVLVQPAAGFSDLNDALSFPEDLGTVFRMAGVEPYIDYVLGHVFLNKTKEITDPLQLRLLRLSCLDFALTCLDTFNEDLFVLGSRCSSIAIDVAVSTTDLATYARLHPFARVMEWMFNDDVITALLSTVHQEDSDISKADPESPLILSVLRAISVITKVLDLQETYLDLVRPIVKASTNPNRGGKPVANAAFSSFEDGIMTTRLELVVDLARYCSFGGPLIRPCLALLSRISTSSKIVSSWNSGDAAGRLVRRNKAIVALEQNSIATTLSHNLSSEIVTPLDPALGSDTPAYEIKLIILDFLFDCLRATPNRPSIGHLCLGFTCGDSSLSTDSDLFLTQKSLFHSLTTSFIGLSAMLEQLCGFGEGVMPGYLLTLRHRILRIVRLLWSSSLSASLVLSELRVINFPFHLLSHEVRIQPELCWDEKRPEAKITPLGAGPDFLVGPSGTAYVTFLATRAMVFEYVGKELCSVSQSREHPTTKRNIFEALNGQVRLSDDGGDETLRIPNIFDFFDFLSLSSDQCDLQAPAFRYYKDMDLSACADDGGCVDSPHAASLFADAGVQYNIDRVRELLRLKRNEWRSSNMVIRQNELAEIEQEESMLLDVLSLKNRVAQLDACRLRALRSWANLLLVMLEANEFRGSVRLSFLLQSLQATLPSLESLSETSPIEGFELARLAKALLFKLDFSSSPAPDAGTTISAGPDRGAVGNLVSEKLFLLFQTSLGAISKWAGGAELRSIYYAICWRYLTGVVEGDDPDLYLDEERAPVPKADLHKTTRAIQVYGDRLLNVVCDDAYGSDPGCQTAALALLDALVSVGSSAREASGSDDDDPAHVVEALNRLNFIGVIVDSLKTVMTDWHGLSRSASSSPTEQHISEGDLWEKSNTAAKLALLLRLCQSRRGAHHVLQAGLFRALDQSDAFAVDPELVVATMLEEQLQQQQQQQQGGASAKRRNIFAAFGEGGRSSGEEAAGASAAAASARTTAAALERHYALLVSLARIVAAAALAHPAAHHATAGRRFVAAHRSLVAHTLKRSAGIGASSSPPSHAAAASAGAGEAVADAQGALEERIEELAEAFMVLIAATGFLEAENDVNTPEKPQVGRALFH